MKKIKRTKLRYDDKKIAVYGGSSYHVIIPSEIVKLLEMKKNRNITVEYLEGTNYFTVIMNEEE